MAPDGWRASRKFGRRSITGPLAAANSAADGDFPTGLEAGVQVNLNMWPIRFKSLVSRSGDVFSDLSALRRRCFFLNRSSVRSTIISALRDSWHGCPVDS